MTENEEQLTILKEKLKDIFMKMEEVRGSGSKDKIKEGDTEIETQNILQQLITEYNFINDLITTLTSKPIKRKKDRITRRELSDY